MKRCRPHVPGGAIAWTAAALSLWTLAAPAQTELGIRWGRGDLRGARLFPGSGDLGGTELMGLQVIFGFLPILDLEVAGEIYDEDFSFEEGRFGDFTAAGSGTLEDLAILGTAKLGLPLPLLPLGKFYGGLGLSVHFVDLEIREQEKSAPAEKQDSIEEAIQSVAGESTEVEWHAVLGLKMGLPVLPLAAFAEARYQDVMDERIPDLGSAYIGLNLRFE